MGKKSRRKEKRPTAVAPANVPVAPSRRIPDIAIAAGLLAGVAFLYAQVRTHAFINFDDPIYVTQNPPVLAGLTWSGVSWAFTTFHASYWHPITWLSHMLDVTLFGRDAGRHLLMSAALHGLNVVLLFLWLRQTTKAVFLSAITAALFAVHPLHVESVAWVAERKDTLSTFFLLLTLLPYSRYAKTHSRAWFVIAVIVFVLGLMSKPMLVTTPFLLMLVDFWPLQRVEDLHFARIRRLILEKIAFVVVTIPSIIMTILAQRTAMATIAVIPLPIRLANAVTSYVAYITKTVWPTKLAVMYPYTSVNVAWVVSCSAFLACVTVAAIRWRRSSPWVFVGWFWFLGSLVPVIGLIQVGLQARADRFTYIPHIGLFVAMVWSADAAAHSIRIRQSLAVAAVAVLIAFSWVTYIQIGYWADSRRLFEHAVAVTANNHLAHVSLGGALLSTGDFLGAEHQYRQGAGFRPAEIVHIGLALSLAGQGRQNEATEEAREAVRMNPNSADTLATLGTIELSGGQTADAERMLRAAAAITTKSELLARLALSRGDFEESRREFEKALAVQPDDAGLHNDFASVLAKSGDDARAIREYRAALDLNPNLYDAHMNYGALLSRRNLDAEAIREFEEGVRLRPASPEPYIYLALVQAGQQRFSEAEKNISNAVRIDHDSSNRYLTNAIRIPADPRNIDRYLASLHQQARGSGA
jgi:tetratricopeptide (TPR) repeat protein